MGRRRSALPGGMPEAFTIADARNRGIRPGRLDGDDLIRPHHGVRAIPCAPPVHEEVLTERERYWRDVRDRHLQRMRHYLPVLPAAGYFCGPTAAFIWGIPLPPREWSDLHIGVPRPQRSPRRPGVAGHQHSAGYVRTRLVEGVPVTDPASTWATLGGLLGVDDLVVAADHVLHIPRMPGRFRRLDETALATRPELELLADRKGRPGAPRLRQALELARTGSASPPETRVRLLMHDAGLPEPVLDHDVYDDRGRFLGCSELAYPELRVAIEYEGDGHLTPAQLRRDVDKYQSYAEAGWMTVRLTSEHVFRRPGEAIRRIRHALRTARS
ncbi:hypothetical protein [Microbacterium esteraromaticum]|uniref:hypothetical protein n=1 Tax=Microbacterium esteraromaticum TaxID=57043 RepID=UPI001C94B958|nr:hypothetical protein [Microbacterium esteraromaticum]MBY6062011.1 hypothetical protein [Microbacterium esteraromaticum]